MAGPHRKKIDKDMIIWMTSKGYTIKDIAVHLGISVTTLEKRAQEELARGRILRDGAVRAKQFEVAIGGNPTMLIFLGKQWLGQSDRQEVTGAGGGPIQYERADLKQLSDTELDELAKLVDKAHEEVRESQKKIDGVVPREETPEDPGEPRTDCG